MIRSMLLEDLKNICLGVVEKYDPERYEIMLNKADRSILKDEREETSTSDKVKAGIATAGTVAAVGTVAAITAGAAAIIPSIFAGTGAAALGAAGSAATTAGLGTSALSATAAHKFSLYSFFKKKIKSKKSDQEIADRLVKREGAEHVITLRENIIYGLLEKEIDELIDLIFVLVKEDKGIFEESKDLFIGSLSKLLFEANESGEEISVQDIKDYLKSSGILIYNKDSRVTGKDLVIAEKELIGSIAAIFKSHFDVNVKGAAGYKKLDTRRVEVSSTVNQNAEKGQPASEQISNMTAGVGIPMGMNAPFDMNQMAAMINMMGGNPMMSFMMMMMNPQFLQQMMQMQKQGVTFGEASKVVAEKTEISDFDRLLEDIIENQRSSLSTISKKDAIKVVKLCKNIYEAFNNIADMKDVTINPDNKKGILFKIQNFVNISNKEDNPDYDNYTINQLQIFLQNNFNSSFLKDEIQNTLLSDEIEKIIKNQVKNADHTFDEHGTDVFLYSQLLFNIVDLIKAYIIYKFVSTLFEKDYNTSFGETLHESFTKKLNFTLNILSERIEEEYNKDEFLKELKVCLDKIEKHINDNVDFDVSKITVENKLIRNKSIIRRRPIRKNKIINESEFLKSELKRLWKL